MKQGLIIDLRPTILSSRDGVINYPSGNNLVYTKDGYGSIFDYEYEFGKVRFNNFAPEWIFIPVESNFCVKLTEDKKVLKKPHVQLSIPRLKQDELYIMAILHETGHANFFDILYKNLPENLSGNYTNRLINLYESLESKNGKENMSIQSERSAWAFALRTKKHLKMLEKIDKNRIKEYYVSCLSTYGEDFHN